MTTPHLALGRWPNAPLALVVAQVRFIPQPDTAPNAIAERILNTTGRSHPHTSPLAPVSVIIGQAPPLAMPIPTPPAGLDLRNDENTEVIRLQMGSLTFLSSAYQDSAHFIGLWRTFMAALCEESELQVVRLGLRYIDFIIPSDTHVPEDYFLGGLGKSPDVLGEQSSVAFNLYDFPREDGGQLRVQYGRGFGTPALPPDLQDSVLLPAHFANASPSKLSAVLDMDRWRMVNQPLAAASIVDEVDRLRADLSQSFRRIMSPLAQREWMPTTEGETQC